MGIFKRRDAQSGRSQTPPVQSDSQTSLPAVSSAASSSTVQAPPPRRVPIPRQVTVDHFPPPPIQSDEIEVFAAQIGDLDHCIDNSSLFDVLIGDIDRNRLTQMTMILADIGDYPTMTRVMELTEKLDRLIARRMEETHEQQRKSFFSDQPGSAKTLDELLSEADQIIARSDYTEAEKTEIRSRIAEFDHYFFTFQNETIEQVLMLSEKIDEMRKRFRRVQSGSVASSGSRTPPAQPVIPDEPYEPWVLFAAEPVHVPDTLDKPANLMIDASPTVGEGRNRTPEMSMEDFPLTPTEVTRYVPPEVFAVSSATVGSRFTESGSQDGMDIPDMTAFSSLISGPREPTFPDGDTDGDLQSVGEGPTLPARPRSSFIQSSNFHPTLRSMSAFMEDHNIAIEADAMADRLNDRLAGNVLLQWRSIMHCAQHEADGLTRDIALRFTRRCIDEWRIHAKVNPYFTRKFQAAALHTLRVWKSRTLFALRIGSEVDASAIRKLAGPVVAGWSGYTIEVRNRVFSFEKTREDNSVRRCRREWLRAEKDEKERLKIHRQYMLSIAVLRAWKQQIDCNKEIQMTRGQLEARITFLNQATYFRAWRRRASMLGRVRMIRMRMNSQLFDQTIKGWYQQVSQGKASRLRVSALRKADENYREWKSDQVNRRNMEASKRLPLSPSTEYYFIHDEPTSPFAKETVVDINKATEEIIIQTQTFLSQRTLIVLSPARTFSAPFQWPKVHPQNTDRSDDYFVTFEKKWALEEAKWRL